MAQEQTVCGRREKTITMTRFQNIASRTPAYGASTGSYAMLSILTFEAQSAACLRSEGIAGSAVKGSASAEGAIVGSGGADIELSGDFSNALLKNRG